jgi:hypothetical protein
LRLGTKELVTPDEKNEGENNGKRKKENEEMMKQDEGE